MQHTTNYNLNQYEATDRVTREDFNADNQRIDAALTAVADAAESNAPVVVKLLDYTVPSTAQQVDVDLSGVDLTQYVELWVRASISVGDSTCVVRVNNISDNSYRGVNSTQDYLVHMRGSNSGTARRFILTPDDECVIATNFSTLNSTGATTSTNSAYTYSVTASTLESLNFCANSGYKIGAGGKIWVYGLKK